MFCRYFLSSLSSSSQSYLPPLATTKAVIAASALAACVDDKSIQKGILYSLKSATGEIKNLMNVSKAVAANPGKISTKKNIYD